MDTGQWLTLAGNVLAPSIGFASVAYSLHIARKNQNKTDAATIQSAFLHESSQLRQERIQDILGLKAEIRLMQADLEEKDNTIQRLREENFNLRTQLQLLKTTHHERNGETDG